MANITLWEFKEQVDEWIKDLNSDFTKLKELPKITDDNTDNIQHNYELIAELKAEIDDLKQEIRLLKLMQLVTLKEAKLKK